MRYHLVAGNAHHDSHALVWGSGLAGLLAARVLVDHFPQVTLVDHPATVADHQPLGTHGQRLLERLFPGITTQLMLAGAPAIHWTADCLLLLPTGWLPRFHADLTSRLASPALLERLVRQRVQEYGGTRITFDASAVTGYAYQNKQLIGLNRTDGDPLTAQLVVDVTGQHPASPAPETRLKTGVQSVSALFRPPDNFGMEGKALVLLADTQPLRGGWLLPIEGGQWLVTLLGQRPDLPTTAADFPIFAQSLRHPALREALTLALPLADTLTQHDLIFQYDRPRPDWPHNLLLAGGAHQGTNGFFSARQALLAASALSEVLTEQRRQHPQGDLSGLAARFQSRLRQISPVPWWLARVLVNPQPNAFQQMLHTALARYSQRVLAAAPGDKTLAHLLWQTVHEEVSWRAWINPALLKNALRPQPARPVINRPIAPPPFTAPAPAPRKITTAELAAIVDMPEQR